MTKIIADDNGFELLVSYNQRQADGMFETELESVEMVIAGQGLELLYLLTGNQKRHIISKLIPEPDEQAAYLEAHLHNV